MARLVSWMMISAGLAACAPQAPGESAEAPSCLVSRGMAACDGRCVDLQRESRDCGACGNQCAAGEVCRTGSCAPAGEAAGGSSEAGQPGEPGERGASAAATGPARRAAVGPRGLGGGTWIARGPFIGGRLDAIVVSPSSSSTVLAGSPGGGVWRTINNGASWIQPLSYALGDFSITHMAWDRASANNLFMTTYNGLYATTDLGDHFTALVNSGAFPAPLMPLRVGAGPFHTPDPYGFAQLVLGATRIVLYAAPCQGLYYSYDGVSFTQSFPFSGGSGNPDNCIQSIAADDTTGYVYFSTMGGGAALPARLYRSAGPWTATTPSLSWNLANTGLPNGQSVNSLTQTSVAGGGVTYPNNLAAVVSTSGSGYKVWTTSDGTSWSMTAGQATSANWDARVIAYPGGNDLFIGMPVGWASQNYGATFNLFSTVSDHPDLRAYYFSPAFGLMWGANDGSNAAVSQRNITRWSWSVGAAPAAPTAVPTVGISGWQAYFAEATAAPTVSGRRLFTGSQDDEILCSDDQGASWTTAGTPGGGDALALRYSPAAPGRAFFITDDGNLQYSSNVNAASCAGVTWTNVAVGYGNPEVWTHAQIAASPTNASKVYLAGIANKLWAVTIGAGNVPHTTPAPAISVIVDGAGALVIGTEGSGLYRSIDDGATWSSFGLNAPAPQLVLDLAWSPTGGGAGTYFAATTGGLYRLPPGGAWTLVNGGGGYTVSAVAVDPHCASRIYDGFGYVSQMGQHRGGVMVSSDGGATWSTITSGLAIHQSPVAALQVDPSSSRYVYAASYGLGTWVYDYGIAPGCP